MISSWLGVVLLVRTATCLPVYSTTANATFALVLCRGLDAAVTELHQRELDEHAIGADWLERDCVSIDPCFQKSSNEDQYGNRLPAPVGVWLSGNSSALLLPLGADRLSNAEAGVTLSTFLRPSRILDPTHASGSSHRGRDLCPLALQCPHQESLLGPAQSVMLMVIPTLALGVTHALQYDVSCHSRFGMVA